MPLQKSSLPDDQDRRMPNGPSPALRVIGACCGAFVLGFIAIMISSAQMQRIGEKTATLFWVSALTVGAVGGFAFPRAGHFLGYAFLVFINVMLSLTIGRNWGEQLLLFAIFAFIEYVFFMSRRFVRGGNGCAQSGGHDMSGNTTRIMYIERKSNHGDRGPARIGRVSFSATGKTIYYGGRSFQSCKGRGISANFVDVESGDQYWISGPKKNGEDRHWAGGGPVHIDADVADEYWADIRKCAPPKNPLLA